MIITGDSLVELKKLEANSIDSVVTDPPYGLSFMGKKWDYDVPSKELWQEVFRVLKPGGHLLSFGGTRTYHRLVVAIEDAGFEIRDQIQWLYGSGFPKSHNIDKAIDKLKGAKRKVVGKNPNSRDRSKHETQVKLLASQHKAVKEELEYTLPESVEAKRFQGWGTALKPANEPICVARKPLEKGLTVAENVLKYGTGAINIDECRIETVDKISNTTNRNIKGSNGLGHDLGVRPRDTIYKQHSQGRWPANVIFDEFQEQVLILQDSAPETIKQFIWSYYARYSEMSDLQKEYANLSEPKEHKEVLQQEVLLQRPFKKTGTDDGQAPFSQNDGENDQDKTSARQDLSGHESSNLQGDVLHSRVSNDSYSRNSKGRAKLIQENVSHDQQDILRGTQISDGATLKETSQGSGNSPSQKRSKGRQSDSKSRIAGYKPSQERALASIEGSQKAPLLIRESDLHPLFAGHFESAGFTVRGGAAKALDEQSGTLKSGAFKEGQQTKESTNLCMSGKNYARTHKARAADSGGASRFFYCAKASKSERNAGLEGMPAKEVWENGSGTNDLMTRKRVNAKTGELEERKDVTRSANHHPTVKPIKLMEYLIKLVTPPNGTVLDPFAGSGSTGVAAINLNRKFIGIELDPNYAAIAKSRIEAAKLAKEQSA